MEEMLEFIGSYNRYNEIHIKNLMDKLNNGHEFTLETDMARRDFQEEQYWLYRMKESFDRLSTYKRVAMDSVMKASIFPIMSKDVEDV